MIYSPIRKRPQAAFETVTTVDLSTIASQQMFRRERGELYQSGRSAGAAFAVAPNHVRYAPCLVYMHLSAYLDKCNERRRVIL
jgi:hypothetical protein